ncbi:hypothetical protein J2857_005257 [Neorhizobium galegae]|uniref:hypothetical protein n=1 Tax=Neorhizobium galegae TaxID=399 RepID=UPI001AE93D75|nr:hypothetical protein [Neorhizobium galegae]MBP2562466.1 hypothetical protein [Neorhizobium galegae]
MELDYKVGVLGAADVYRAFAVIQHVFSDLDLEKWKALTATAELRNDWLVVKDARGYIRGLCYVFTRSRGVSGLQMEIPIFASVSLFDEQGVARRLFEFAKARAKLEACSMIHFWSGGSKKWSNLAALIEADCLNDGLVYDLSTDSRNALHPILPVKM